MALHYPMAMVLNKGHKVTKNISWATMVNASPNTQVGVNMTWEVFGFASEKQSALWLLKVSKNKQVKLIKKWTGTHIHAKRKQEELSNVLAAERKAAAKDWVPSLPTLCITKSLQKKNTDIEKQQEI